MKLNLIITGATGMVGEGVLNECLQHKDVDKILVINRKSCGVTHPKLTEIIHNNFFDLSAIQSQLSGYNVCFFCLGKSSIGMKETEYYALTYTLTMGFAQLLARLNPDMTFCYISGAGTDSTENGKIMWAKVKGKTENDLLKLPFKKVYNFRPAYLHPSKGMKNTKKIYYLFSFLYPILRFVSPNYFISLKELGLAMINTVNKGYEKQILEVPDILKIAKYSE